MVSAHYSPQSTTKIKESNTILQNTISPVSHSVMLDFSSVLLLRQDETVRLGAPSSIAKGAAGAAPPLLESIPTASFCSILSSMSTQGQGGDTSSSVRVLQRKCSIQVQQQKRSIFSHYWMKTGQNPIELTPSTAEDSSESALTVVEAPQNFGHDRQE